MKSGTVVAIVLLVLLLVSGGVVGWSAKLRKCDDCTDTINDKGMKCQRSWKFWNGDYPRCTCNGGDPCGTDKPNCVKGDDGNWSCVANQSS